MATVSFDKNIVIKESEAIDRLVKVFSSKEIRPINKQIASEESMAKGEEILRRCLSRSKDY